MQIDRKPLFERLAAFPRLGLANLPTPLEPMKRLTAHLGGPRLWVKREDFTGLDFGGNKLRKLDYVLHKAVSASNAMGAVGYATTIAEIEPQAARLGSSPAAIVHCTGSSGTQAGLVVGAAIAMPGTRIVGIDIDAEPARVRADVVARAQEASHLLDAPFDEGHVEVVAGHAGPAYGVLHEATIVAIRLAGRLEALPLDPVYSGKGLCGLDCPDPRGTLGQG